MLKSAWNQKGQLLSDLFRKKQKPIGREQGLLGPSQLSMSHSSHTVEDETLDATNDANVSAPVLPDTVALVRTPEEIEPLVLQASLELEQRDDPSIYSVQTDSQQSLEQNGDQRKSGRMNRLIHKLRSHKRD